jgi:hypothetical protein
MQTQLLLSVLVVQVVVAVAITVQFTKAFQDL